MRRSDGVDQRARRARRKQIGFVPLRDVARPRVTRGRVDLGTGSTQRLESASSDESGRTGDENPHR